MAKNALQYITKSDPRYQWGARESEAGPSNAFDPYLSQMPQGEAYWRKLGYGGEVLSGQNSDATDQQISPELMAYIQNNGFQMGTDGDTAMNALIGPDGNPVAGSEYSVDDTGDFMRDALLVAGGGYLGGSALTGTGMFAGAGAGAGAAGAGAAEVGAATAGGIGGAGGTAGTIGGYGTLGADAAAGLVGGGGAAGGSLVAPGAFASGGGLASGGAVAGFGGLEGFGAAAAAAGGGGGGGGLMQGIGDFFTGNASMDSYLRAGQLVGGLYAQNKAAGAAKDGQADSNALIRQLMEQNQPLVDFRNSQIPRLNALLKDPGKELDSDPFFGFEMRQGQKALDNKAAASGSYYSGAQLKATADHNRSMAGSQLDRSINRITGAVNLGQIAANQNGALGSTLGDGLQRQGNIRAGGYLGGFTTANNAANGWIQDQYDRKYWGGGK